MGGFHATPKIGDSSGESIGTFCDLGKHYFDGLVQDCSNSSVLAMAFVAAFLH